MKTFNQNLTIEEATVLFQYKGTSMWPDTKHNREVMAAVAKNHLLKLQGK